MGTTQAKRIDAAHARATRAAYAAEVDFAIAAGLDTASSASRQHWIDTGEFLPYAPTPRCPFCNATGATAIGDDSQGRMSYLCDGAEGCGREFEDRDFKDYDAAYAEAESRRA